MSLARVWSRALSITGLALFAATGVSAQGVGQEKGFESPGMRSAKSNRESEARWSRRR
jgi:hypothetical protein